MSVSNYEKLLSERYPDWESKYLSMFISARKEEIERNIKQHRECHCWKDEYYEKRKYILERDLQIFILRVNSIIENKKCLSYKCIGAKFNLSTERIRQILTKYYKRRLVPFLEKQTGIKLKIY